jgi:S-adenosylmethionine/arginine decarboxylase-like enzyme
VLSAVPEPSFRISTSAEVILGCKAIVLFECRRHSRRPKVWADRILRLLDARLDQPKNVMVQSETHDSALLVHPWPSSMFYSVGVVMCPDEASKTRRDGPKGQI